MAPVEGADVAQGESDNEFRPKTSNRLMRAVESRRFSIHECDDTADGHDEEVDALPTRYRVDGNETGRCEG